MNYHRLYLIALINGIILIAALLFRKENRFQNYFLAALLASVLFSQWVVVLTMTGEIDQSPWLLRARFPIQLLVPSLFYFYILALTVPGFQWSPRYAWHFLPFLVGLIAYIVLTLFTEKGTPWREDQYFLWQRYIFLVGAELVTSFYLIACFRQLIRFQQLIPHYFSDFVRIRLRWLQGSLIIFAVPWIIIWVDIFTGPSVIILEKIIVPVVLVIILLIGFFGLRQSVIFSYEESWEHSHPLSSGPTEHPKTREKEIKPLFFSSEELLRWKGRVEKYMEEEKIYLEPEHRLVDLAHGLGLKPYQVSEIINRGVGIPFYDFVNRYRIEEAKRRLKDPAMNHLKILAIAMDCGFNSKSSFNDTFRRFTGATPSQFRSDSPAP